MLCAPCLVGCGGVMTAKTGGSGPGLLIRGLA